MGMTGVRAVAALLLGVLVWVPAAGSVRAGSWETVLDEPLTVMTRNVFLGTDLFPVIEAASGLPSRPSPAAVSRLASATHAARAHVEATDFGTRAGLIADEIRRHEPDPIGLQEVALWRSGPFEPDAVGVPNAAYVDHDFLAVLLAELGLRDLAYRAVATTVEVDLESPSFPANGTRGAEGTTGTTAAVPAVAAAARDVRVTLRDVILLRTSDELRVQRSGTGHYRAQKRIDVPGPRREFTRGYGWVDLVHHDDLVRFVNTHLEVGDPRIGHAQARELVAGPAHVDRPVVVVCDCNSDPTRRLRGLSYRVFRGAGFVDQWLTLRRVGPGHTCCVPNTLRASDPDRFDHRVDFVFARATRQVRALRGAVLGRPERGRRDGLRPSDHAGIAVTVESVR